MIEQQTVVDQIEVTRSGVIQIRFGLLMTENGIELNRAWHRVSIQPGASAVQTMAAVNEHLLQLGRQACPVREAKRVLDIVKATHTPAVVKAFRESQIPIG